MSLTKVYSSTFPTNSYKSNGLQIPNIPSVAWQLASCDRGPRRVAAVHLKPGQADKKLPYLWTEIGALNTELDTCRTLKFGVPAAALRLTLPSGLRARHASVCRRSGGTDEQPGHRVWQDDLPYNYQTGSSNWTVLICKNYKTFNSRK